MYSLIAALTESSRSQRRYRAPLSEPTSCDHLIRREELDADSGNRTEIVSEVRAPSGWLRSLARPARLFRVLVRNR